MSSSVTHRMLHGVFEVTVRRVQLVPAGSQRLTEAIKSNVLLHIYPSTNHPTFFPPFPLPPFSPSPSLHTSRDVSINPSPRPISSIVSVYFCNTFPSFAAKSYYSCSFLTAVSIFLAFILPALHIITFVFE